MRRRLVPAILLAAALGFGLAACTGDGEPDGRSATALLEATGRVAVTPQEAQTVIGANPGIVIFDLRTAVEYGQGHLPNAYSLSYDASSFVYSIANLSQAASYLVYGTDGDDFRAGAAADALVQAGFIRVYVLEGGLAAWPGELTEE
ncbi:MAG: rhodanese-like domain-containing protein [Propionibacteriaceae bacterium]|jgi:rhodanese-related sulfurtransferase|nr:rhodanese-like domain-containing protein [Propionibacteriaceae bacterium]